MVDAYDSPRVLGRSLGAWIASVRPPGPRRGARDLSFASRTHQSHWRSTSGSPSATSQRCRAVAGFTLIELIVVIVILGIISAVAIPSFLSQRRNGFDAQTVSDVRNLTQVQTGLVVAGRAPILWRTGDDDSAVEGFIGSDQVQHKVRTDENSLDWCVAGWHPRGSFYSLDNPVWASSDNPVANRSPIPAESTCARLLGVTGEEPPATDGGDLEGGPIGPPESGNITLRYDLDVTGADRLVAFTLEGVGGGTTIDWGHGPIPAAEGVNSHSFTGLSGTREVTISGTFTGITQVGEEELVAVMDWADTGTTSAAAAFEGSTNLRAFNVLPTTITDTTAMFRDADLTGIDLTGWDVRNVRTPGQMFYGANLTNASLSGWTWASAQHLDEMFDGGTSLTTANLPNWNTGPSATPPHATGADFTGADIAGWTLPNATSLTEMFGSTRGNTLLVSNLSGWDAPRITSLDSVFEHNSFVGVNMSGWNVPEVASMEAAFASTNLTGANLAGWNVSAVTNMGHTFRSANLTGTNIDGWNHPDSTPLDTTFQSATLHGTSLVGWNLP